MKINGYAVRTGNAIYGPFPDAGAAGEFIELCHGNFSGSAEIVPLHDFSDMLHWTRETQRARTVLRERYARGRAIGSKPGL